MSSIERERGGRSTSRGRERKRSKSRGRSRERSTTSRESNYAIKSDDISNEYIACYDHKCGKKSIVDGFSVFILPKNTHLYRGYKSRAILSRDKPMWFSDPRIASVYTKNNTYCKSHKIMKDLVLVDITDYNNIKKIYTSDMLTEQEKEIVSLTTGIDREEMYPSEDSTTYPKIFCSYSRQPKDTLKFCPVGWYTKHDQDTQEYINLRLARIVCRFGYDGWIVPKNKGVDYSMGGKYHNEVLLCRPSDSLQIVKKDFCKDYF